MLSRRSFLLKSAAAASAALIAKSALGRTVPLTGASPLAGKKVLFVWGGWMAMNPTNAAMCLCHGLNRRVRL